MVYDKVASAIMDRVLDRVPWEWLKKKGITRVFVAGNSLNRDSPNDIDLFPVEQGDFLGIDKKGLIVETKNARTYKYKEQVIQLCNYHHASLYELVESFDYAHIQVGAYISNVSSKKISDLYGSQAWFDSHALQTTWFTGSEYPLSSLIRSTKYIRQGAFSGKAYIPEILKILIAIIRRGFKDYPDFKDQLDAVDLGLVDKDLAGVDLKELYRLLHPGEDL